jgi:hypothetical protein
VNDGIEEISKVGTYAIKLEVNSSISQFDYRVRAAGVNLDCFDGWVYDSFVGD